MKRFAAVRMFGLLLALAVSAAAQSTLKAPHVTLSLVAEDSALKPNQTSWVGIRFQLEKGWHVYWTNPGDSGEPPKVEWHLPPGFKAGELQFPLPHRIPLQTLMNFAYEGDVLYPVQVTVPAKPASPAKLTANVRWMICKDTCIPGKGVLSLSLPVSAASARPGPAAQLFKDTRARLPRKTGLSASIASQGNAFVFTVRGAARKAEFFPLDDLQIENAAAQQFSATPGGFRLSVKKSEQLAKLPARLRGLLVLDGQRAYAVDLPIARK